MEKKHKNHDCGCKEEAGWIPVNSRIQVNTNRSISIQAPPGWEYLGRVKRGSKILRVASGGTTSVSCTCNSSGSCLPFIGGGDELEFYKAIAYKF